MDDSFAVGIPNGVGNLPQHVDPLFGCQFVAIGRQIVVQADGMGIKVSEEECRAILMIFVIENRQNPFVFECLDDLKFTPRGPLKVLSLFLGRCVRDCVLSYSAINVVEFRMFGQSVLVSGPIGDQFSEDVITHTT